MKLKKEKNIFFTPMEPIDSSFYPSPAIKNIPHWYKKTKSFYGDKKMKIENGIANLTIKKCIPVFDAMTMGYIIYTHKDIYVYFNENGSNFASFGKDPATDVISMHPNEQAEIHPFSNKMPYPKINNYWAIRTSKGYSSLFVPPMHNPNGIFNILPGVVDTDRYAAPVNFPFVLINPTFEGIIPAGTAVCQVIPFKRDNFLMKIKQDPESVEKAHIFLNKIYPIKFMNNYKKRFWEMKKYI